MNAANLCPSPRGVLDALYAATRDIDRDPSFENRAKLGAAREETRKILADFLRVSPEEIVITRNTSESNNLVSSGLELKPEDEVLVFSDNHPSNLRAWHEKARRFGFTVRTIDQVQPHPGPDYYVEAFKRLITTRTRLFGFTHLTNTVGDLLPARELCRVAREHGILTLVDGAQTFGLLDVDLGDMKPDFYSGSAHKWPCGPRESGVLFIDKEVQSRLWPSIYSAYPGAVGVSKTCETFGQRDDAAIVAFGEALRFQNKIGRSAVEQRSRELAAALMDRLRTLEGVTVWTHPDPERSAAVVAFHPGSLDPRKLAAAFYSRERIACTARAGNDRPGLRLAPHIYNSMADVERVVSALTRYMKTGV